MLGVLSLYVIACSVNTKYTYHMCSLALPLYPLHILLAVFGLPALIPFYTDELSISCGCVGGGGQHRFDLCVPAFETRLNDISASLINIIHV